MLRQIYLLVIQLSSHTLLQVLKVQTFLKWFSHRKMCEVQNKTSLISAVVLQMSYSMNPG
jgi:hypothetical protein